MAEIQSLARGLKILNFLSESSDGASITELADFLSVDKASASRLVSTLAQYGYAEKDERSQRYLVGSQIVFLSRSVLTRLPLREAARPFLREMMEKSGECAHLAIASQGKALYIDQAESPVTLRVNAQVGTMNPLHCTALGKILLAYGDMELPKDLPAYTEKTITDQQALQEHLEKIREQGFATDDEEFDIGVRCIAVPVFDFNAKAVGAIGISGPTARVTHERLNELTGTIVEIGKALSERMSFT